MDQAVIQIVFNHVKEGVNALNPIPRLGAPRRLPMHPAGMKPPCAEELAALIGRVAAARDRQAFAILFGHFAPRIKTYFLRGGLDNAPAEELAQEVMLSLWRRAGTFDAEKAAASTWVFAIARNARIDLARRKTGLPPEPEAIPAESAETLFIAAENATRLRDALGRLSAEQRQILELSFFADTPHSAIARELAVPLGTVKSRIRLALGRLRLLMGSGG